MSKKSGLTLKKLNRWPRKPGNYLYRIVDSAGQCAFDFMVYQFHITDKFEEAIHQNFKLMALFDHNAEDVEIFYRRLKFNIGYPGHSDLKYEFYEIQ